MRALVASLIIVFAAAACGGEAVPPTRDSPVAARFPDPQGTVYRVRVRPADGGSAWIEWIAPASSHCRRQGEQLYIAAPGIRAVVSPDSGGFRPGAYLRVGSPAFVGDPGAYCFSLGGSRRSVETTIEERLTAAEAKARGLFSLADERLNAYDREGEVGELAALPFAAYWFGPSFEGRSATTAIEHYDEGLSGDPNDRRRTVLYDILYGGEEVQVVGQPVGQWLARRSLAGLERWPHTRIALANGERAVVVPNLAEGRHPVIGFHVITETTLVGVTGRFELGEIPALASRLRPIGPE